MIMQFKNEQYYFSASDNDCFRIVSLSEDGAVIQSACEPDDIRTAVNLKTTKTDIDFKRSEESKSIPLEKKFSFRKENYVKHLKL